MNDLNIDELFCCPVCEEKYDLDNEKNPLCLECGHTLCKKCLNDIITRQILQCPLDSKQITSTFIDAFIRNKIIEKAVKISNDFIFKCKNLTKLEFFYCYKCDLFLSCFSKELHLVLGHRIDKINKYAFKWMKIISDRIKDEIITENIKLFFILYLFHNPFLLREMNFTIEKKEMCNKDTFTFYGSLFEKNEENEIFYNILFNIIKNDINLDNNYELFKGIALGKNSQIINGFFLMKKDRKNKYTIKKSLGLMNFMDNVFFGLLDFSNFSENSGIKIDAGILDDNLVLFFGSFKQDMFEFPIYNFENGEKITFNEDSVVLVERFRNKISQGYETLFSNSFFNFEINSNKITLEIFDKLTKNNNNLGTNIKLELNKINNSLKYLNFNFLTQKNEENEKVNIIPLNYENNFEFLTLKECYLNFERYKIKIIFNDDNSIIICSDEIFNMKNFKGYEIKFSEPEDIKKINELKDIKIKEIINKNENEKENFNNFKPLILNCLFEKILNIFKETFYFNLNKFDIYYCDIIKNNNNNFDIDKNQIYVNLKSEENLLISYSKNKKKYKKKEFFVKNLNKMSLNDIFPDLIESKISTEIEINKIFNSKNGEKKRCSCIIF